MGSKEYSLTNQDPGWEWTDWKICQGKQEEALDTHIRQSLEEASYFEWRKRLVIDRTQLWWKKWKTMPRTLAQSSTWGCGQKLMESLGIMDLDFGSSCTWKQVVHNIQIFTRETWQYSQKSLELQDASKEISTTE